MRAPHPHPHPHRRRRPGLRRRRGPLRRRARNPATSASTEASRSSPAIQAGQVLASAGTRPAGKQIHPKTEVIITRTRVNQQIQISPVRLIGPEGEQLGIVPIEVARENATEHNLDLVEVAPTARPPVVRIMDWGKHQYEEQKRAKEARKRQHTVDVKEVKFRPGTESHDFQVKVRNARRFLESGKKVKVTVRYRGREMRRPELGHELLNQVAGELTDLANVEARSDRLEARQMTMVLAPQ